LAEKKVSVRLEAMKKKTLIFSGGGSGGHVIPALTLIAEIKKKYSEQFTILYIGSEKEIEKKLTANAGIEFRAISTGKLRRYLSLENLLDLFRIIAGIFQSISMLFAFKSRETIVFSTGGFVSVPVVFAAWLHRIPILVHEQTSRMGLANKISSYFAKKILISFEESFKYLPREKTVLTGYPVRKEFFSPMQSSLKIKDKEFASLAKPLLFITGGGNGSYLLNIKVKESLADLTRNYFVVHQVGAKYIEEHAKLNSDNYLALDFIGTEMVELMKRAEVIISRAGAGTVCELMALKKASIFIPLKIAQKNEQYHNAKAAEIALGSLVITEDDFKNTSLNDLIDKFRNAHKPTAPMASTQAIELIIDQILKI
jgi:UDP-N-acetylglucosamine--N-acetylmuramyl-(pentapeptide) pyrophosphoryl-undecaprenol N-acetylglucosamine transferase